jgi:alkyl sulfatase BDS1-like metallo-beta-lactamase superfamily hydrolase
MRVAAALLAFAPVAVLAQMLDADNPLRTGANQQAAVRVNEAIYLAYGFGNTFLVTTSDGNVVIDTSSIVRAPRAKELLQRENAGPIKYIILTHGHGDHTGGVQLWKGPDTQVIAQQQHYEFVNYQTRLAGFFAARNAAQFNFPRPQTGAWAGNYGAQIVATVQFADQYQFTLGDTKFELYSTPGETPDHLTVWLPRYRAAFVGDNYYESFPNIYTLRGTQPRWALDYVASLDKVLALKPELLLPSHGEPVRGNAEITRRLTQYRDAIQYVHDAVVKGMNDGKDVFTLMHEIKLPRELEVGEGYGNLIWSIRGIYEGYAGWFDMQPTTMYDVPVDSVFADLAKLAGGAAQVTQLATTYIDRARYVEALHLTDVALASDPQFRPALAARLKALESLKTKSSNSNERGWLDYHIRVVRNLITAPAPARTP